MGNMYQLVHLENFTGGLSERHSSSCRAGKTLSVEIKDTDSLPGVIILDCK